VHVGTVEPTGTDVTGLTVHPFALTGIGSAPEPTRRRLSLNAFDRAALRVARRTPQARRSKAAYANALQRWRTDDR